VIITYQFRTTCITLVLTHSNLRHWLVELHWCRIRSCCRYNHGIRHCTFFLQSTNDVRNCRVLLTYRYIYTEYWLTSFVKFFLIQNGVDTNSSLTCLTVTNHKLTLSTSDWNHGIDRFKTSLQWFSYWLTVDNSRSFTLDWHFESLSSNWAFTIDRLT